MGRAVVVSAKGGQLTCPHNVSCLAAAHSRSLRAVRAKDSTDDAIRARQPRASFPPLDETRLPLPCPSRKHRHRCAPLLPPPTSRIGHYVSANAPTTDSRGRTTPCAHERASSSRHTAHRTVREPYCNPHCTGLAPSPRPRATTPASGSETPTARPRDTAQCSPLPRPLQLPQRARCSSARETPIARMRHGVRVDGPAFDGNSRKCRPQRAAWNRSCSTITRPRAV